MYRTIVRARVRMVYERMNAGDLDAVVADSADDIRHSFPGNHALGGERRSRAALVLWLERLHRLFPDLRFQVLRVASTGGPWSTWASAAWKDTASLPNGERYENEGVTWINIRWGRVTEIHEYADSERVADACRRLAAAGVHEASAEPIGSANGGSGSRVGAR